MEIDRITLDEIIVNKKKKKNNVILMWIMIPDKIFLLFCDFNTKIVYNMY